MLVSWLRGSIVLFCISFLLFASIGFVFASEDSLDAKIKSFIRSIIPEQKEIENLSIQENIVYIEDEVYKEIEQNGSVKVIVYLSSDGLNYSSVDVMKKQIKERQDKVLNELMAANIENNKIVKNIVLEDLDVLLIDNNDTEEGLIINGSEIDENKAISDEEIVIEKNDNSTASDELINNKTINNFKLIYRYEIVNGLAGVINKKGLEVLEKNDLVKAVYLERTLSTSLAESVKLVNVNRVWNVHTQQNGTTGSNITGAGQIVCVVDTGVDYTNPALGGCLGSNCKVLAGYNFINNTNNPMDYIGHGTHVAGIAAANGIVRGVAPDAKILAASVCTSATSCSGSAMVAGVDWCVNQHLSSYDVDVITMSLGDGLEHTSANCPTWMDNALAIASFYGIPITVSSGNEVYSNGINYPACNQNVISVGAVYDANVGSQTNNGVCTDSTTFADKVACFSNTGINLDVMAPGAIITSTASNIGYRCGASNSGGIGNCSGTSMAAPHVAGTIALIKQIKSLINPAQIEDLLKTTGKKVTDPDNGLNFTRIDAVDVINKLVGPRWGDEIRLTFNNTSIPGTSDIEVDSQHNIHIVWQENKAPPYNWIFYTSDEAYYKKLDRNGNVLINDTRLSYSNFSVRPVLDIDSQDNVHIAWVGSDVDIIHKSVFYKKLDSNGSVLINDTKLNPEYEYVDSLSIDTDSQDNVHIIWVKYTTTLYDNGTLYYKKLDSNGSVLVNNTRLIFLNYSAGDSSLEIDVQDNLWIAWEDSRDPPYCGFLGGTCNSEIYIKKLDSNGSVLINDTRLTSHPFRSFSPSLNIDGSENVDVTWFDMRDESTNCGYMLPAFLFCNWTLYYKKLDSNGSVLVNETKLTYNKTKLFSVFGPSKTIDSFALVGFNKKYLGLVETQTYFYSITDDDLNWLTDKIKVSNSLSSSIISSFDIDSDGYFVIWNDFRYNSPNVCSLFFMWVGCVSDIYFRRTYPQIDLTLHGSPAPGNIVNLELQDEMNRNKPYVAAFSEGTMQGITLPDGRNIPLNFDALLSQSIYYPNTLGISNSSGVLDDSGRANVTLTLPNVSLSGLNVYGGFVTIDPNVLQFAGISDPMKITFV